MSNQGMDFSSRIAFQASPYPGEKPLSIGNDVHVWRLCRPAFRGDLCSLHRDLSLAERKRALSLDYACERDDFVLGRSFLRRLLSRYTGLAGKEIELASNAHGKPFLSLAGCDLRFSAAQSGNEQVFVFAAGREVGVDIELIDYRIDELSLAISHFSAMEVDQLAHLPVGRRVAAFYRAWTQKEAYMKALGLGYAFSSKSFSVEVDPKMPPGLVSSSRSADISRFHFREADICRGYICMIAVEGRPANVRVFSAL